MNDTLAPAPIHPKKLTKRARRGVDMLLSGECKTVTAAAERIGMSRGALSRALNSPEGRSYVQDKTAAELNQSQLLAARVATELLASPSEHVKKDTAFGILAIAGFRTTAPVQPVTNINVAPGYVIDLRNPRDETAGDARVIDHEPEPPRIVLARR